MTRAEIAGTETRTAKAVRFLQAALTDHPVPAAQVTRVAHEHGLTAKAIRSARESLAVQVQRSGFGRAGKWLWSLPPRRHIDAPAQLQERDAPAGLTPDETRIPAEQGSRCDYCDRDGAVYVLHNPFDDDLIELLHEDCARHWHEWLGNIRKDARDRMLHHARDRMLNRARGKGGRGPV
jgi:hypothetical protein